MNTSDIADGLKLTAKLMELHNENPFKIRSLSNAAFRLDKSGIDIIPLSLEDLSKIEGIGKGIAGKIVEFREQGTTEELKALVEMTPAGVIEMMSIKGIGPKKVAVLWKELGVESVGELLYACRENRLVGLKGFGAKTQEQVKKGIEFLQINAGKFHYAAAEPIAERILEEMKKEHPGKLISLTGEYRRKCEILDHIDILLEASSAGVEEIIVEGKRIIVVSVTKQDFFKRLIETTGNEDFLMEMGEIPAAESEKAIFQKLGMKETPPELWESTAFVKLARSGEIPELIDFKDLRGCLHNHSTWSDGLHSLEDMAFHCKEKGYEYFGICDHSRTASYAGGLSIENVVEQQEEIDQLNDSLAPFRIFKGIESDILGDGSLDYPDDILKAFDIVVASIHQNLKMEEEKAMKRLLRAIENPFTTILGHPTGRLLLSREGYPIDHKKIIDACAANGVAIELNAHPWRLDIDWRWVPYCMEKGVMISINPDAHEKDGIYDMYYGVLVARKGMLTKEYCLNALGRKDFEKWLAKRR